VSVAQYLPILTMIVLVVLFVSLSFAISILLGVRRPTRAKTMPYECGIVPEREPVERFPVKFYLVALTFIVLDVEIIFLYPFTTVFRSLGGYGLAVMGVFLLVLIVPFAYLLSVGAIEWGPVRQVASRIVRPVLRAAGMPDGVDARPTRPAEPDTDTEAA
jgi:NADH-quinone oxidoreductase subunit A